MEGTARMSGRRLSVAVTLTVMVLAGMAAGGCVSAVSGVQVRDTIELSLAAPPDTPARVETFNGGIDVRPASGPGMSAAVVRTGWGRDQEAAEADRDAIEVTLELIAGVAVLRAIYTPNPSSIPGASGAAVTLLVPPGTGLELVTSNGPISAQAMSAGLDGQTSNGPVELIGVAGDVSVQTSNGPVSVTTDVPVRVDLRTSNGGITFDGRLLPGEAVLETSNGPVELRLPADAAFTIDAETSASPVSTEFDVDGTVGDGAIRGAVGRSDQATVTSITVRTSNGPVRLLQD